MSEWALSDRDLTCPKTGSPSAATASRQMAEAEKQERRRARAERKERKRAQKAKLQAAAAFGGDDGGGDTGNKKRASKANTASCGFVSSISRVRMEIAKARAKTKCMTDDYVH
eukprot:COSAG05_NODE_2575_length_2879_cov_16.966187_4_plen_113_part_00